MKNVMNSGVFILLLASAGPSLAMTDGLASDKLVSLVSCEIKACEDAEAGYCFVTRAKIESALTRSYNVITSEPTPFSPAAKSLCEEVNSILVTKPNYQKHRMVSALLYSNKWTNPGAFSGIEFLMDVLAAEGKTQEHYEQRLRDQKQKNAL